MLIGFAHLGDFINAPVEGDPAFAMHRPEMPRCSPQNGKAPSGVDDAPLDRGVGERNQLCVDE